MAATGQEHWVASLDDLRPDRGYLVQVGERVLGLFRVQDAVYAYENLCPHMGGPVCQGEVLPWVEPVLGPDQSIVGEREEPNRVLACPWHGVEFDIARGVCVADSRMRLRRLPVTVRGRDIYVTV